MSPHPPRHRASLSPSFRIVSSAVLEGLATYSRRIVREARKTLLLPAWCSNASYAGTVAHAKPMKLGPEDIRIELEVVPDEDRRLQEYLSEPIKRFGHRHSALLRDGGGDAVDSLRILGNGKPVRLD